MSKHKRQHYVPQSYLKAWSTDERRIWMFDKVLQQSRYVGINSVAQETYFNDSFRRSGGQITDGEAPDLYERQFQVYENQFLTMRQVALDVAANKRGGSLEERKTMAVCAALQLLRTAKARQALIREAQEVAQGYSPEHRLIFDWIDKRLMGRILQEPDFIHENISLIQTHLIWNTDIISHIAADLYYYIWVIARNLTDVPFYTSDAPIAPVIHDAGEPPYYPTPRAYSQDKELPLLKEFICGNAPEHGLELVFPVSPDCAILMFHPLDFLNALGDRQGAVLVVGQPTVMLHNVVIAQSAVRQVLSLNDEFSIAQKVVKGLPDDDEPSQ